ncbi:MAG: hypothetical protein NWF00_05045 [Candidatus Bathyarchaeota archaeon]|nr:hypothetical protein [Candidatus Bathyarchaeota archaeon]
MAKLELVGRISLVILLVCTVIVLVFFAGTTLNQEIEIPTIEIPQEPDSRYFAFDYPPTGTLGQQLTLYGNGTLTGLPLFTVQVSMFFNGPLAEKTPVNVVAQGPIYSQGQQEVFAVYFGFEGATYSFPNQRVYTLTGGFPTLEVDFTNITEDIGTVIPPFSNAQIANVATPLMWTVQGDYYPYINIFFKNGTTISVPYPDYKVHVSAADEVRAEIEQERTNKINLELSKVQERDSNINITLSIVLTVFASIEILILILDQSGKVLDLRRQSEKKVYHEVGNVSYNSFTITIEQNSSKNQSNNTQNEQGTTNKNRRHDEISRNRKIKKHRK